MRTQGIKIRLTIIVGSLLLVGMLLVNFVLINFWQRDALQRELGRDQAVLARLQDQLLEDVPAQQDLAQDFFAFADFYSQGEEGRIILYSGNRRSVISAVSNIAVPQLAAAITEAVYSGKPVVHYSGSFLGRIRSRSHVLVVAEPVVRRGSIVGAVGISRSLEPMFDALWQTQKAVFVYILINFLVLTVVGFFRMSKLVVRPIDRLVRLADRYSDQEAELFAAESSGGEFGRLANSLNRMLARIDSDRTSLEETVKKLAGANRQLKSHQEEMLRTEKLASVGRMAAGLAHEIGNPLGIVQGYLGLLGRSANQSDEHLDYIVRAEKELQRVNALIRQMLDFARVSKGEPEEFSLHDLLRSVVDMVRVQPVFGTIKLECRLESGEDTVFADKDQLRQVFVNCLLNSADAVQAAERGSEGLITVSTVVYSPRSENDQAELIRIQIRDNGIGIIGEELSVVFDPFYTTKEPGRGTGLGLSVSLSIVESMGGTMEMESDWGQGSVLSVFLKIAPCCLAGDHDENPDDGCTQSE